MGNYLLCLSAGNAVPDWCCSQQAMCEQRSTQKSLDEGLTHYLVLGTEAENNTTKVKIEL